MGVEGAPEGPEDYSADLHHRRKVRRLTQKNTRTDFKKRFSFLFLSFSLSRNHPPPPKTKSLLLFLFLFFFFSPASKESRVIVLLLTVFLSLYIYIHIHTHTGSRLGNVRRSMKDAFKLAAGTIVKSAGGAKRQNSVGLKVVGQFPEDEFDDEGRFRLG